MDSVVKHSAQMIRQGSKSFSAAARFFDNTTRESAYMLYAWCRHCDDQIDGQTLGMGAMEASGPTTERLAHLYDQTRCALGGQPVQDPIFIAFQRVVQRHAIPARYPLELLDGFAMDVNERCYESFDDTLLYCYHVAGVVGVMMAYVMGVRDRETLHRAADLGIAFQLTNIARDVVEDAGAGRVYLPSRWLDEVGLTPAEVLGSTNRLPLFEVVRRLLLEAEHYYASANGGLPRLDLRSAWAVATARDVYRDIGRLVLKRGPTAWDKRVVVSRPRKLYHAMGGAIRALVAVSFRRHSNPPPRGALWTKPDP